MRYQIGTEDKHRLTRILASYRFAVATQADGVAKLARILRVDEHVALDVLNNSETTQELLDALGLEVVG